MRKIYTFERNLFNNFYLPTREWYIRTKLDGFWLLNIIKCLFLVRWLHTLIDHLCQKLSWSYETHHILHLFICHFTSYSTKTEHPHYMYMVIKLAFLFHYIIIGIIGIIVGFNKFAKQEKTISNMTNNNDNNSK